MTTPTHPKRRLIPLLIAAVVAITTFAVFSPAISNQFIDWDDTDNFVRNPHYRGLGVENIKWAFSTFHMGTFSR